MAGMIRIGAGITDDPTKAKCLAARIVTNNYHTFETPVGVDYQVPAGYTFYITKLDFAASAAAEEINIGYGDDGVNDSAAAPTNYKQMAERVFTTTGSVTQSLNVCIPIPAGKYPCLNLGVLGPDTFVNAYGIEVANP